MSKRKNKDKASSVYRAERLLQIKDADAKVYEIMPKEVINEERRKQIKELHQQIRDIESKIEE